MCEETALGTLEQKDRRAPSVRFIDLQASWFPTGTTGPWAVERPSLSGNVARLRYFSRGGMINQIAP